MAHNSNGRSIWQRYISGLAGFLNAWYSSTASGNQAPKTSWLRKANSVAGEIIPQTGDFSVSFWAMMTDAVVTPGWYGFIHRSNVYQYQATVNGITITTVGGGAGNHPLNAVYFAIGDGTVAVTTYGYVPTIKEWALLTLSVDRTANIMRVYVNDATTYYEADISTITGNIGGTTQNFNIGSGVAVYQGYMRNVCVANKALSKAEHLEMFSNYASKSPVDCSFSANIIHYWKLESDGNATIGGVNLSENGGTNYYPTPAAPLGAASPSNYIHLDGTSGCYLRGKYLHSSTRSFVHTIRFRATAPFHFGAGNTNGFYVLSGTSFRIKASGVTSDFSWAGTDLLDGNWHTLTIGSLSATNEKWLYCDGTLLQYKASNNITLILNTPWYIGWDGASDYDEMDVSFYSYFGMPTGSATLIVDEEEMVRLASLGYILPGAQATQLTAEEGHSGLISRWSNSYAAWCRGTATFNSPKSFAITRAVYFDGINDLIATQTNALFIYNLSQWSISFWVEIDNSLNTDAVLCDWSNTFAMTNGFRLETVGLTAGGSCKLKFTAGATTPASVQTDANCLNAGQKHLVVIRFKGSTDLEIKVDGAKPAQTVTGTVPATTSTAQYGLYFGGSNHAPARYFKGKIAYIGLNITISVLSDWTDANDTSHWNSGNGAYYIEPTYVYVIPDAMEEYQWLRFISEGIAYPSLFKSNGAIVTSW